jgi:hypothetical protein
MLCPFRPLADHSLQAAAAKTFSLFRHPVKSVSLSASSFHFSPRGAIHQNQMMHDWSLTYKELGVDAGGRKEKARSGKEVSELT